MLLLIQRDLGREKQEDRAELFAGTSLRDENEFIEGFPSTQEDTIALCLFDPVKMNKNIKNQGLTFVSPSRYGEHPKFLLSPERKEKR